MIVVMNWIGSEMKKSWPVLSNNSTRRPLVWDFNSGLPKHETGFLTTHLWGSLFRSIGNAFSGHTQWNMILTSFSLRNLKSCLFGSQVWSFFFLLFPQKEIASSRGKTFSVVLPTGSLPTIRILPLPHIQLDNYIL